MILVRWRIESHRVPEVLKKAKRADSHDIKRKSVPGWEMFVKKIKLFIDSDAGLRKNKHSRLYLILWRHSMGQRENS